MEVLERGDSNEFVISTTLDEVRLLYGCVLEAIEAVEEWEFQTRTGYTKDEAWKLLKRLQSILDSLDKPNLEER